MAYDLIVIGGGPAGYVADKTLTPKDAESLWQEWNHESEEYGYPSRSVSSGSSFSPW